MDIRLKQLARDLIKPPAKRNVEPRTLAYLKLVMADKSRPVLFASFPSSGWNWTMDVVSYALTKHLTGDFRVEYAEGDTLKKSEIKPFDFSAPADSRARNFKPLRETFPEIDVDYSLHSHGIWKESALWGLDSAKTIMLARDIRTALYSFAAKRRVQYASFEECIDKTGMLTRAIRFYNSWAQYKQQNPDLFSLFQYEKFRENPVPEFHSLIQTAFGVDVPKTLVAEAVDYYDFDKQKQRELAINPDEKAHFHYKGKTSYREEMGEEYYARLSQYLRENLIDTFGYDY
jgi:hypothetical protein